MATLHDVIQEHSYYSIWLFHMRIAFLGTSINISFECLDATGITSYVSFKMNLSEHNS